MLSSSRIAAQPSPSSTHTVPLGPHGLAQHGQEHQPWQRHTAAQALQLGQRSGHVSEQVQPQMGPSHEGIESGKGSWDTGGV